MLVKERGVRPRSRGVRRGVYFVLRALRSQASAINRIGRPHRIVFCHFCCRSLSLNSSRSHFPFNSRSSLTPIFGAVAYAAAPEVCLAVHVCRSA